MGISHLAVSFRKLGTKVILMRKFCHPTHYKSSQHEPMKVRIELFPKLFWQALMSLLVEVPATISMVEASLVANAVLDAAWDFAL